MLKGRSSANSFGGIVDRLTECSIYCFDIAVCAFDLDASSDAPSCKKDFCIVRINDANLSTKVYDARITFNYTILSPTKDEDELESLHYALKSAMTTCLDRQIGPIVPQEMAF